MKKRLFLFLSILSFGLTGCAKFYSCEFKIDHLKCSPVNIERLMKGLSETSDQFGLRVYISDERSTIFRKGPNETLPERYQLFQPSTKMEITLVYHPATCRVILSQREQVEETAYMKELRASVDALLEDIFGRNGYQMNVGTKTESPLA